MAAAEFVAEVIEGGEVVDTAVLTDQPAQRRRRGPNRQKDDSIGSWGTEDLAVVQSSVILLFLACTNYGASKTHQPDLAATQDEAKRLSEPVARIFARHIRVKKARQGDIADALTIATVLAAYGMRIAAPRYAAIMHTEKPETASGTAASGSPISLDSYGLNGHV